MAGIEGLRGGLNFGVEERSVFFLGLASRGLIWDLGRQRLFSFRRLWSTRVVDFFALDPSGRVLFDLG